VEGQQAYWEFWPAQVIPVLSHKEFPLIPKNMIQQLRQILSFAS